MTQGSLEGFPEEAKGRNGAGEGELQEETSMDPLVLALSSFFRLQPHGWPVPVADLAFLRPFQHPLPISQD